MIAAARMAPEFFRGRLIAGMLRGVPLGGARDFAYRELSASEPSTVMQAARAVIRFSSRDWASNITVPTAVVITTKDLLVSPRRQYLLAESIPGAKIFEVHGDHLACVRASERFVPKLVKACQYVRDRADAGKDRMTA